MYARRFSSITTPNSSNLKCALKEKCLEKFSIAHRTFVTHSKLETIRKFNDAIDVFIKKVKVFRTNFVEKSNPDRMLKIWIRQFECVFAQRVRRGQQMFCMYSKWWEERALKEFIKRFRVTVNINGRRLLMGSSIGVSLYNWEENRIKDEEFISHLNDLIYIENLKANTVCVPCDNEKVESNKNNRICNNSTENNCTKTYDDWTLFIEKDDLIVWRRLYANGLYEYKVYGSYYDVSAEDFLNVQVDTNYRKEWDTTAIQLEIGERDPDPESSSDILYWEMQWPRLFVNRDYVFNRRYKVFNEIQTLMIINKTTEYPQFPRYPDKYRVEEYWSCMVIKPYTNMREPGIEFSLTYFDNPGVNIPSTITTWVAKSAMPDFLNKLRNASRKYKEYCLLNGTSKAFEVFIEEKQIRNRTETDRKELDYCANVKLTQRFNDVFDEMQNVINEKILKQSTDRKKTIVAIKSNLDKSIPGRDEHLTHSSNSSKDTNTTSSNSQSTFWKYLHPLYYFT